MRDGALKKDERLQQKILNEYLVDQYASDDKKRIKLKQVNQDSEAYELLFDENPEKNIDTNHNIYKNYAYLKGRIKGFCKENGVQTLYEVLQKMKIVRILLKPRTDGDKPQLVFETINGTGKQLEAADLIRNFILMDKEPQEQIEIFEKYWKPIEQNTRFDNQEETTDFIWYFLMLKEGKNLKQLKQTEDYSDFKNYINDEIEAKKDMKNTLEEIKVFSGYYKQLAWEGGGIYERYYKQLRDLKQTTCYSYLMSLMDYYKNQNDFKKEDMEAILGFIITYYLRRLLNKDNTNEYNDFFPTVCKKIKSEMDKGKVAYKEAFYYVFANHAPEIPTNEVLKNTLSASGYKFYKLKIAKYLFSELVNKDQKEKIEMDKITIEHIMPQTLTDKWRRMLGEDWEEVHTNYLHSLGNLTVTGYNSELGNKAFQEKKTKICRK